MNDPARDQGAPPVGTRPAWPLFVLAGLSFTPVLGFFVGAVGASWGLLSSRRLALRAAAISATGALLNVVVLIVAGVFFAKENPAASAAATLAAAKLTRENLVELVVAVDQHKAKTGEYPVSLQVVARRLLPFQMLNIYDQSSGVFSLPRPYHYTIAADGESFDLFGVGPDGEPGTGDDVRPELPDSLRGRSGFKPPP